MTGAAFGRRASGEEKIVLLFMEPRELEKRLVPGGRCICGRIGWDRILADQPNVCILTQREGALFSAPIPLSGTSVAVETKFLSKPIVAGPGTACTETYLIARHFQRHAALTTLYFPRIVPSRWKLFSTIARNL